MEDTRHKNGYILLSERIEEEDGLFTAFCDELGIATYSKSYEAASRRLEKSILFMLNTASDKGEVDQLLSENGIREYPVNRAVLHPGYGFVSSIEACSTTFGLGRGTIHRPYLLGVAAE